VRVYFDTEFIEDGRTIDLVSIGMVREDGRTYYAQALSFDPAKASRWVEEHVLAQLARCDRSLSLTEEMLRHLASGRLCSSMCLWRSKAEIGQELRRFVATKPIWGERAGAPEFWADYASYDWLVLCQIFGTMLHLPDGWPMFVHDVQQARQELTRGTGETIVWPARAAVHLPEHHALNDARDCQDRFDYIEAERQKRLGLAAGGAR
jgi:hypothetical protein